MIPLGVKVLGGSTQLRQAHHKSPSEAENDHLLNTKVYGHRPTTKRQICIYASKKQKQNVFDTTLFRIE